VPQGTLRGRKDGNGRKERRKDIKDQRKEGRTEEK
jgi:hypothetical protein